MLINVIECHGHNDVITWPCGWCQYGKNCYESLKDLNKRYNLDRAPSAVWPVVFRNDEIMPTRIAPNTSSTTIPVFVWKRFWKIHKYNGNIPSSCSFITRTVVQGLLSLRTPFLGSISRPINITICNRKPTGVHPADINDIVTRMYVPVYLVFGPYFFTYIDNRSFPCIGEEERVRTSIRFAFLCGFDKL